MLRRSQWYIRQSLKVGLIVASLGMGGMTFNLYANELDIAVSQDRADTKEINVVMIPKSYQEDTKSYSVQVTVPQISSEKYSMYAKTIEDRINKEMQDALELAKHTGKEYYKAYLATGGKESDYRPVDIKVDYDVKYNTDGIVSLGIYKTESIGSAYDTAYFYNFDLESQKEITLKDFYGEDYKRIIDEQIMNQIKERIAQEDAIYFEGFEGIKEDQVFYINEKGNPVIVFDKHEIAPEFMGMQSFEIVNPAKLLQLEPEAHYDVKRSILPNNPRVSYPKVEGYKGELLQDYINQSLYRVVEKYQKDTYSNLRLDYDVTRMDDSILSVLYRGSVDIEGLGTKMFVDSINIDLSKDKTVDEINVKNFILPTQEAQTAFNKILEEKLKEQGIEEVQVEGLSVYFKDNRAVFYYMIPDDSVQKVVEVVIPLVELEGIKANF